MNKKKIKHIIIFSLLVLIILPTIFISYKVRANNIDFTLIDSYYTPNSGEKYDVDNQSYVYLGNQRYSSNNNGYSEYAENYVLNQPNIYCVQRNVAILNGAQYNVSAEYTINGTYNDIDAQAQMLAYILANGPNQREGADTTRAYQDHTKDSAGSQIALWEYLADYGHTLDVARILGNIEASNTQYSYDASSSAQSIYTGAKNHSNIIKNYKPTLKVTKNGTSSNEVTINVSGLTANEEFKVLVNGVEKTTLRADNNGDKTYTITNLESGNNIIKIKVEMPTTYTVKYRVLSNANNQRLIVVTYKQELANQEVEIEETVEIAKQVSLQKFIVKKNNDNYSDTAVNLTESDIVSQKGTPNSTMTQRWAKLATDQTSTSKDINKNQLGEYLSTAQCNKKIYNPVNINNSGETITYQVCVYNNAEGTIEGINITDYLNVVTVDSNGNVTNQSKLSLSNFGDDIDTSAELMNITAYSSSDYSFSTNVAYTNYLTNISNGELKITDVKFGDNVKAIKFLITIKFNKTFEDNTIIANYARLNVASQEYRTMDADYVIFKRPVLGLEKYISKVQTNTGLENVGNSIRNYTREGMKATNVTQLKSIYNYKRNGILEKYTIDAGDPNKIDSPVFIEKGDVVTYDIFVHNNGEIDANNVIIRDYLSVVTYGNSNGIDGYYMNSLINISSNNIVDVELAIDNNRDIDGDDKDGRTYNDFITDESKNKDNFIENANGEIIFKPFNLPRRASARISITVKISEEVNYEYGDNNRLTNESQLIRNYAYISGYSNEEYRTIDADYVITKKHSVSLEKFITKVTNSEGAQETPVEGRNGKRLNNNLLDEGKNLDNINNKANLDTYKYKNPELVEIGDLVTYTIRLKNTGEHPLKAISFYDSFDYDTDLKYLEYKEIRINNASMPNKKTTGLISEPEECTAADGRNAKVITYTCTENDLLAAGEYVDIEIVFQVNVNNTNSELTKQQYLLNNRAAIEKIYNINNIDVYDFDETDNNCDNDYIKTKIYAVSLEKFITQVNGADLQGVNEIIKDREGKPVYYGSINNRSYKTKNVVTVSNGDTVTYKIKVKNNGIKNTNTDTSVYIPSITDYLPDGVKYQEVTYVGEQYSTQTDNSVILTDLKDELIQAEESKYFTITVEVTEPNISLHTLINVAEITDNKIKNRNGIEILDTTPDNNKDADYIQLDYKEDPPTPPTPPDEEEVSPDVIIGGYVWNDIAPDKNNINYDGIYNNTEKKLSNIEVMLYRTGVENAIAIKRTDENGYYSFENTDINKDIVTNPIEQYIKGPKESENNNRWAGTYYSYYIVFKYDGVTYTSTPDGQSSEDIINSTKDYKLDSNAKENLTTRTEFNEKFSTINKDSKISYTTKNEDGYIPESNHKSDSTYMAMQSSTNLIDFTTLLNGKDYSKEEDLAVIRSIEDKLNYVSLGLRGRDIFDLELTTDIYSTKVTVNNVAGAYQYNNNKVTIRRNDISSNYSYAEDMANTYSQGSEYADESYDQGIRKTDIINEAYGNTGLQVEVIYEITVKNASNTDGTATIITDYYDSQYYTFVGAYYSPDSAKNRTNSLDINEDKSMDPNSNYGYAYKSIELDSDDMLSQGQSTNIYIVYTLNNPTETLKELAEGKIDRIPTYNMAEITEYKTQCANGQTEYTRGLIDKDSAPESVENETVRLTVEGQNDASIDKTQTTVGYYFAKNKLNYLKYEDDTYAAPILYFTSPQGTTAYDRIITGKVFRDTTVTNSTTKIKTGNGILDENEVGVYGAKVELIEFVENEDKGKVRDTKTTGADGSFTFTNFLPGKYIITYYYGDTKNTVLLKQSEDGSVNTYSFNGEDYQSTNNSHRIDGMDTNVLDTTSNYWYVYNESQGISTAKDNSTRRNAVMENVIEEANTERIMKLLNNARDGIEMAEEDVNFLIGRTAMYADTETMLLTVEKTELVEDELKQREQFSEYKVSNMNFGIAEVPVTKINLQKEVTEFKITDSTGRNTIASIIKKNGNWTEEIATIPTNNTLDVSIEDEKLQGARLQVTYQIKTNTESELNFDKTTASTGVTIKELVDIIDNNLSYNSELGDNAKYWELMTEKLEGTSIDNIENYTTIVKATAENISLINSNGAVPITLEKVLSAPNSTLEEIITSTVDIYEYNNTVEILELDYGDDTNPQRDRVRTDDNRNIIIPGVQHDTTSAETITIHPPTGDSGIATIYYVIAVVSLVVIAGGVFGIKKFVISNKK